LRLIPATELKPLLTGPGEIALIDVREYGQYGEGHPFFAVNLPYSQLEARAPVLVPRLSAPLVLIDDGDGVAERAAGRLAAMGYSDIRIVEGGAPAWAAAGFTLFQGVNLPSKTFGELVEHAMATPSISANELVAMQAAGEDFILLDGRTAAEHGRMTLPGARHCPNAEMAYRLPALGLDPATRIVVHCAGRTRSIIGAQTLRNLGVSHEVVALENGTQGWELAGLTLTRGQEAEALPDLLAAERVAQREAARALMARAKIARLSPGDLAAERRDASRTQYLFDVRTGAEFAAGYIPGAIHAPGGQLVQATDHWIAVRGARVVLCDDVGLRAATTALWLRGMGHDVAVLDADAGAAGADFSVPAPLAVPDIPAIAPAEARERMARGAVLLDLRASAKFRAGHPEGARWAIRPRIATMDLAGATEVLLIADDPTVAAAAALDITDQHGLTSAHVTGTLADWRAAGAPIIETPDDPPDQGRIDYLFFTHDRHSGNLDAAQQYLDWETGLIGQLDEQERGALRPELSLPG